MILRGINMDLGIIINLINMCMRVNLYVIGNMAEDCLLVLLVRYIQGNGSKVEKMGKDF